MSYSSCIHGGACTGCMACQGDADEYICADCGDEIDSDELYEDNGDWLCEHCLLLRYKVSA